MLACDRIGCKGINCLITTYTQSIQTMGPLPQTPDDIIVALTLQPFVPDQSTMCDACAHGDDIVEEVFRVINDCLNRALSIEDTVTTIRGVKARPIRKQGQQTILGYQTD